MRLITSIRTPPPEGSGLRQGRAVGTTRAVMARSRATTARAGACHAVAKKWARRSARALMPIPVGETPIQHTLRRQPHHLDQPVDGDAVAGIARCRSTPKVNGTAPI